MVRKTWKYQKIYKFETKPEKGHEFWDVEADAFKHTFGSAILYFRYGDWGSTLAGMYHESQTKNNPEDEWNMDSWNNDQGRKIAKEIIKEYGKDFYDKNPEKCEQIIAAKTVVKMRNGELINHPDDKRKFQGVLERLDRIRTEIRDSLDKKGKPTGQAAPVSNSAKSGTLTATFTKPDTPKTPRQNFSDMIRQKYKTQQAKSNEKFNQIFKWHSTTPNSENGHWVTMNGAHVFIEDK